MIQYKINLRRKRIISVRFIKKKGKSFALMIKLDYAPIVLYLVITKITK
jgi:hypothetical protein